MTGFKHVGSFVFHARTESVLLNRGSYCIRGNPFGTLLDITFYFVLKIAFLFAARTGTRTTRTSKYSTTTLMATERKTLEIAEYSIKLMLTGRGSDVERRERLGAQRER